MIDSSGPVRRPERPADAPWLVVAVVRGAALLVVLPARVLWELLGAGVRWTDRWLLTPVGRFLERWLLRPVARLLRHLLWVPLVWLGRALVRLARWLVWLPLVWLARGLAWLAYHLFWRPVIWLGRVLAPVFRPLLAGLIAVLRWLGRGLRGIGAALWAAVRWAWWAAGRVLLWTYVVTLRPVVLAVAWVWRTTVRPVGRAVAAVWGATVTPVVHWVQDTVVAPTRAVVRDVLAALGLRRRP
ncbi:hypothetical protein [Micromonospora sp. NPDC049799]|uniref:hypothetical protein n=1 Tax=Micromonospora sp. NPDC049799 TaxID=3154741 RepID=UPI0033CAB86E